MVGLEIWQALVEQSELAEWNYGDAHPEEPYLFLGPSIVPFIRSSRCHESPGHDIAYFTLIEFTRFGLKLTASSYSCAAKILVRIGYKQSPW